MKRDFHLPKWNKDGKKLSDIKLDDVRSLQNNLTDKHRRVIQVVLSVLLALMLLIIAMSALQLATWASIKDGFKSFFTSLAPGKGYPYSISSDEVQCIEPLGGDLYVVTDDKALTLDTTGKVVNTAEHTYANPGLYTNGSRGILYNRGENRYRVVNRTDTVYEGSTAEGEEILTAAIGKRGNIALATRSDKATSRLTVYDNKYDDPVFVWNCADYTITSVSLSDNGDMAAVTVFGAVGAECYSKVFVFDFDYSEPVSETEYPGTALVSVRFASNKNVVAIGDNAIVFLKDLEESETINFESSTLVAFAHGDDGDTAVVLSKYGSSNDQTLTVYTGSGKISFEESFTEPVKAVDVSDSRVGVLFRDRVEIYGTGGHQYKSREAHSDAITVYMVGKKCFLYQQGALDKPGRK